MIIARQRKKVIRNIKKCISKKEFHSKVEPNDPTLTKEQSEQLIEQFWKRQNKIIYKSFNLVINGLFNILTSLLTQDDQIQTSQNLKQVPAAFITCNHYNQLDVLPIKKLAMKYHKKLFYIVKDTNLIMPFPIGFLVRSANSIPLTNSLHYLRRELTTHLKKTLNSNAWILIYPEQEMWFNYRKPRPLAKGAYYYAAKLQVPIISCFVEIQDKKSTELFHRDFHKTRRILHILPTIYPDPNLSVSQNTERMRKIDFQQKKRAYEKAYGKKLNYKFSDDDIAGYKHERK